MVCNNIQKIMFPCCCQHTPKCTQNPHKRHQNPPQKLSKVVLLGVCDPPWNPNRPGYPNFP